MVSAAAITLNTVSCAVPVAAFLYFFTVLGSGVATFEWSERHDAYGNPLLGVALALPMVIYVCDGFNHWQRTSLLLAKRALLGLAALCFVASAVCGADYYPYAPICLFLALFMLQRVLGWRLLFAREPIAVFFRSHVVALVANAGGALAWWLHYLAADEDHVWDEALQVRLAMQTGCRGEWRTASDCEPADEAGDEQGGDLASAGGYVAYDACLVSFILWVSPVIISVALAGMGYMCHLLAGQFDDDGAAAETARVAPTEDEPAKAAPTDEPADAAPEVPGRAQSASDEVPERARSASDEEPARARSASDEEPGTLGKQRRKSRPSMGGASAAVLVAAAGVQAALARRKQDPKRAVTYVAIVGVVAWSAASLAGAGEGLATAMMAMCLALVVGAFVFALSAMGVDDAIRSTKSSNAYNALVRLARDYAWTLQGLFVVTSSAIVVPAVLALSAVNQLARRCGCGCAKALEKDSDEARDWVTLFVRTQLEWAKRWAWTQVLTYAIYWGVAYVTLQVVISKFTVLFLSWLIDPFCDGMSWPAVTAIILVVGLVMFLLPPVPGMPIYLAGGILITAAARDTMDDAGVIAFTCTICLALKMLACTVQQKIFGERLGSYVYVRQLVGVNSDATRVMRLILAEPGLSPPKVAILLGGPDWPTSVLCGILRLPLGSILLGTLPIIVVIVPAVAAGAFMFLAGQPGYEWASTLSTVAVTVTGAVQMGAALYATFQIEHKMKTERDMLADKSSLDQEVLKRDEVSATKAREYLAATQWPVLSRLQRAELVTGTALMIASCYLLSFFWCFRELDLTDTVRCHLNGHGHRIVYPVGWVALALFCASCALLYAFTWQAERLVAVRAAKKNEQSSASVIEVQTAVSSEEKAQEPTAGTSAAVDA